MAISRSNKSAFGVGGPRKRRPTFVEAVPPIKDNVMGTIAKAVIATATVARAVVAIAIRISNIIFRAELTTGIITKTGQVFTHVRNSPQRVFDHEGKLLTLPPGEAGFIGTRRVFNYLENPNDFSDPSWVAEGGISKVGIAIGVGPNGEDAFEVDFNTALSQSLFRELVSGYDGGTIESISVRTVTGASSIRVRAGANSSPDLAIDTAWRRLTMAGSVLVANDARGLQQNTTGDTGRVYLLWAQSEDSTGRADLITPSEYTSKGELSAPWHGAGIDGSKWFNRVNGNTVLNNIVTENTGALIPDATLKGLLLEKFSSNKVLNSSDLSLTWTTSKAVVGTDTQLLPDKFTLMNSITDDNSGGTGEAQAIQAVTITSAEDWCYSGYFKSKGLDWVVMRISQFDVPSHRKAYFDLNNGLVGSFDASISSVGILPTNDDGVYLCWAVFQATTDLIGSVRIQPASADLTSIIDLDGSSSIYAGDLQLQKGNYPDSRIRTGATTEDRELSDLSASTTGFPVNGFSKVIYVTFPVAGQGVIFLWGTWVDANNYTAILHDGTNIIFRKRIAGVNTDVTKALAYVADTRYKIEAKADSVDGQDILVDDVAGTNHTNTADCQFGTTFELNTDGNGANSGAVMYRDVALKELAA